MCIYIIVIEVPNDDKVEQLYEYMNFSWENKFIKCTDSTLNKISVS